MLGNLLPVRVHWCIDASNSAGLKWPTLIFLWRHYQPIGNVHCLFSFAFNKKHPMWRLYLKEMDYYWLAVNSVLGLHSWYVHPGEPIMRYRTSIVDTLSTGNAVSIKYCEIVLLCGSYAGQNVFLCTLCQGSRNAVPILKNCELVLLCASYSRQNVFLCTLCQGSRNAVRNCVSMCKLCWAKCVPSYTVTRVKSM
jgi:hypothetical protein